jgi:hypothetical protein
VRIGSGGFGLKRVVLWRRAAVIGVGLVAVCATAAPTAAQTSVDPTTSSTTTTSPQSGSTTTTTTGVPSAPAPRSVPSSSVDPPADASGATVDAAATIPYGLPSTRPAPSAETFPNDPAQSGWYPNEPDLAPAVVGSDAFGELFSVQVDGQVYAQPTVVRSTLVVATETNHVYGLDPGTGARRWALSLGAPVRSSDVGCADLTPTVGITSTPAVDEATGTAYVVAKMYVAGTSGPTRFVAYAIDVVSGAVRWSLPIAGPAANDPSVVLQADRLLQRPSLMLMDGVVYAAFGGFCDTADYRGWIAGISTDGSLRTLWTNEAGQPGVVNPQGGIWQGAGPLMSDRPGELLVVTANGNNPPPGPVTTPGGALGQSIVRLRVGSDGSLVPVDYFSPSDADQLSHDDLGIGSGAAELLPSEYFGTPTVPNMAITGSKHGSIYVVDRSFLGGRGQGPAPAGDNAVQRIDGVGGMWSTPAFWAGDGGYVYQTVLNHGLQAYRRGVRADDVPEFTLAGSSGGVAYGSSSPVVTSDGTTSGSALVWMVARQGGGDELRAYDAVPSGGALNLRAHFPVGLGAKFNRVTVDAGRVYVGTRDGRVFGFGSRAGAPVGGQVAQDPAVVSRSDGRLDVFVRGADRQLWHRAFDDDWSEWEPLGGQIDGSPAVASWSAGRLDVFVRGVDGQLWHKWYEGAWSEWAPLGGMLAAGPSAVSWSAGRLDVFARGIDGQLWHKWFDGNWSEWAPLGGQIDGSPAVASWSAGRLDVFARGIDGQLWHKWFDGGWSDWEPLGGQLSAAPSAVSWSAGRLDVFVRGIDGQLWQRFFSATWGSWTPLGGQIDGAPAVASWSAGRLDVFARSDSGELQHKWFGGSWSGWESFGGFLDGAPAAASAWPGRVEVFAQATEGHLVHTSFVGTSSAWESLGGQLTAGPAAASWSVGRLDVFARGIDGQLWHKWFDGGWSEWEPLGGQLTGSPAVVSWSAGRLDVFVRGIDDRLWHKWYEGAWSEWEPLGSHITSAPGVASGSAGRLDVFARGDAGQLLQQRYDRGWSIAESLGGVIEGAPAPVALTPTRLDVFAKGDEGQLLRRSFQGTWTQWEPLGGVIASNPAVASAQAGTAEVFWRDGADSLGHLTFTP